MKHYFRAERRRSSAQLAMDFGDFPPFPLECRDTGSVVRIVCASGIGGLLNCFQISRSLFLVAGSGAETRIRSSLPLALAESGVMELAELLNHAVSRWPEFFRPVVARVFRHGLVCWGTSVLYRVMYRRERGLAVFFPTGGSSGSISLTPEGAGRNGGVESVISHEHLHFLQHLEGSRHDKSMRNLSVIFPAKHHGNRMLLYILERKEAEARLHEIVLSYYRTRKRLPLTPEGFLDVLSASPTFHDSVIMLLRMDGYSVGGDVTYCEERDAMFPSQLADAMAYMTDSRCQYRFITEVLAVMYGNLLRYYGDGEASCRYLAGMERPNLYDVLYGDHEPGLEASTEPFLSNSAVHAENASPDHV